MWEDAAGSGAVWHSSGTAGPAAASLECRVMPAWGAVGLELRGNNVGCCQLGIHKGVPRGAFRHGCHRLRGAAGQGAAISGDKVLPSQGAACCPSRTAQQKGQSARRREMHPLPAGSPDPAPGCPGQDGEAAARGPHGPQRADSRAL